MVIVYTGPLHAVTVPVVPGSATNQLYERGVPAHCLDEMGPARLASGVFEAYDPNREYAAGSPVLIRFPSRVDLACGALAVLAEAGRSFPTAPILVSCTEEIAHLLDRMGLRWSRSGADATLMPHQRLIDLSESGIASLFNPIIDRTLPYHVLMLVAAHFLSPAGVQPPPFVAAGSERGEGVVVLYGWGTGPVVAAILAAIRDRVVVIEASTTNEAAEATSVAAYAVAVETPLAHVACTLGCPTVVVLRSTPQADMSRQYAGVFPNVRGVRYADAERPEDVANRVIEALGERPPGKAKKGKARWRAEAEGDDDEPK